MRSALLKHGCILGLALVGLAACEVEQPIPGTEVMGTFAFTASGPSADAPGCALLPEGDPAALELGFEAILSREQGTHDAWYTLRGQAHPATFDGAVVQVVSLATRRFPSCVPGNQPELASCADVDVEETLVMALLSRSQNDALGGRCPLEAPYDGVPDPDAGAGIRGPGTTPTGFDAVRACGILVDRLMPREGCCAPCSVAYRLEGVRR